MMLDGAIFLMEILVLFGRIGGGTMKLIWGSGLLVEWKSIWPNKKHDDDCPLSYNPIK